MAKTRTKKDVTSNASSFTDCPCVGATLDRLLQPAVLAILATESMHGYELGKRLGEIPGFFDAPPDVSGIYRILKNLEARGMVVAEWDTTNMCRTKRLFTITEEGRHCLVLWNQTLLQYRRNIDTLLKVTRKAMK